MKIQNTLLFLILLSSSLLSAQTNVEWEQINQLREASLRVSFVNSEGGLYGYDDLGQSLYYSENNGDEWTEIYHLEEYRFGADFHLFNEHNELTYLVIENGIYTHDWSTNEMIKVFSVEENHGVEDFEFLSNGNILVALNRSFNLYDPNFVLLNSHEWWTHSASILLGDSTHFVTNSLGASDAILDFSEDLTYISSERPISHSVRSIAYDGEYLLSNSHSSIDGGVIWRPFTTDLRAVTKDVNGEIYGMSYDHLFKFNASGGQRWSQVTEFSSEERFRWQDISANHGKVLIYDYNCGRKAALLFETNPTEILEIETRIPKYNAQEIVAGTNENLIISTCNRFEYYKTGISNDWAKFDSERNGVSYIENLVALNNNTFMASASYELLLSDSYGVNWQELEDFRIFYPIHNKGDKIYATLIEGVQISNNYGLSWEQTNVELQEYDYLKFTDNKQVVFSDYSVGSYSLFLKDFNDGSDRSLIFDGNAIKSRHFETSYTGSSIYVFDYSENSMLRSLDGGDSFQELQTNEDLRELHYAFVDHNNNIYLYNNDKVIVSYDEGESWVDITPTHPDVSRINNLTVSFDDYIYLATFGAGILKSAVGDPTVIKEYEFNSISLNPNPATTSINFDFKQAINNGVWTIHDISGHTIKDGKVNGRNLSIDVAQMKEGLYFIEFLSDNYQSTSRFVKM